MKFQNVADARRHLWMRLRTELNHLENLGVLFDEECEDDHDKKQKKGDHNADRNKSRLR